MLDEYGSESNSSTFTSTFSSSKAAVDPAVSNICSTCDGLFHVRRRQKRDINPIYRHHTIAKLESSSASCEVCALLQSQVTNSALYEGRQHISDALYCHTMPHGYDNWIIAFLLGPWSVSDDTSVMVARISLVKTSEDENPQRDVFKHNSTNLLESTVLAKQWLQYCEENHPNCKPIRKHVLSGPSRLLDIGSSEEDSIRLRTNGFPSGVKYATLSHCWGGHEFIRLTRNNLEAFQKNIPFSSLPKTFQDAVRVSRSLGFRYLWIDSLCIIQGDHADWYSESSRMSSVYGGSGLNIGAAGAKHGNEGLFFDRNPALVKRLLVYADDRVYEEPVNPDLPKDNSNRTLYYVCDGSLYRRTFLEEPLFHRAWVFQERYLAPRTLHFGSLQIFWECQTECCFEAFPRGLPPDLPVTRDKSHILMRQKDIEDEWGEAVHNFSLGRLSNGSDKRIAISGVARVFGGKYAAYYCHGLWRESFLSTLCWRGENCESRRWARPEKKVQEQEHEKRAPSWSWISVDGPISGLCSRGTKGFTCAVVKIEGPDDPYGNDPDGLVTLEVERLLEVTELFEDQSDFKNMRLQFFTVTITGVGDHRWPIRAVFDHYDEDGNVYAPVPFYLLDIMERTENAGSGILLERVRGRKGLFGRIGAYLTSRLTFETLKEARGMESLKDEEEELELYERRGETKENGTRTYILTLE